MAVLLVFCFHYGGGAHSSNRWLRGLADVNEAGWCGVTLFFVLSGFLITGILWDSFENPHWLQNFYVRRALRILPLYYGALLLTLAGAAVVGTLRAALHSIWIPVLFLQNLPNLSERVQQLASPLLLHHLWSLAVEEQFYLLWPLLLFLQKTKRSAARLCVVVFIASFGFRVALCLSGAPPEDWSVSLLSRGGELAAGGFLAMAYRGTTWGRLQRWSPVVLAAAMTVFALTSWGQGSANLDGVWQLTIGLSAMTAACGALLTLALSKGVWQRVLNVAWLRFIGTISFGIYVFHILLRPLYAKATGSVISVALGSAYFLTRFVVAATLTVLISWLSFRFYETRFLRMRRGFCAHWR